jgi:tetratricopeptide (TPR) repeat protein
LTQGAAAYKAGDYPQATQSFQASLNAEKSGSSRRLAEQEDAYYNLGNSLYREGQKSQQSSVEETLATWGRAVKAYDAALQLRTDDADSKFNRDLVRHKIDALKKQQQEKQQQQAQKPQQKAAKAAAGRSIATIVATETFRRDSSRSRRPLKITRVRAAPPTPRTRTRTRTSHGKPSSAAAQGQPPQKQGEGKSGGSGGKDQSQSGNTPQSAGQPAQPGQSSAPDADRLGGSSPRGDRHGDANKSAAEQAAQAADDQRAPGQMSRAEARQLLDSVKDEQQRLPAAPLARSGPADSAPSDEPLKDW